MKRKIYDKNISYCIQIYFDHSHKKRKDGPETRAVLTEISMLC